MKYFWKDKINVNIGYLWEVGLGKWESGGGGKKAFALCPFVLL